MTCNTGCKSSSSLSYDSHTNKDVLHGLHVPLFATDGIVRLSLSAQSDVLMLKDQLADHYPTLLIIPEHARSLREFLNVSLSSLNTQFCSQRLDVLSRLKFEEFNRSIF